jgi:tetraacyldisaccharide 4'-kinase
VSAGVLERREESLARRAALLPLEPLGWLWAAGARAERAAHAASPTRLPCRVVSVGSVVAGGAGKTPAAAWLAAELLRRGRAVVLGSRGYGRRGRGGPLVVSDGRRLRVPAAAAGDEALWLAARAPGVPVLVDADRARLGWRAVAAFGAEILVLDDAFSHHRLARDLDLVLFDGELGFGNGRCLPRGPLREPLGALGRAQAVGVVDGPLPSAHAERLARLAPAALRFCARRRALSLRPLGGGAATAPQALAGREVGLLCGIARPASLRRSVEALGARVVAQRRRADHHRWRACDLRGLARAAPLWITTEKDAVKLARPWAGRADVRVLALAFEVEEPARLVDFVEGAR